MISGAECVCVWCGMVTVRPAVRPGDTSALDRLSKARSTGCGQEHARRCLLVQSAGHFRALFASRCVQTEQRTRPTRACCIQSHAGTRMLRSNQAHTEAWLANAYRRCILCPSPCLLPGSRELRSQKWSGHPGDVTGALNIIGRCR
jgi:hypothetical protein